MKRTTSVDKQSVKARPRSKYGNRLSKIYSEKDEGSKPRQTIIQCLENMQIFWDIKGDLLPMGKAFEKYGEQARI
ncbi:hypothetical protein DLM77_15300 [Leptospira yasudae]|uniref:Uncharacterized protein n=1 Tax=Leptospira yasudae TaxID=2202201 RepID=A0ABX9LZM9_9LEPT|nr:hypothetical protein DLM77_15300 [Leptospira yasudae]